MSHSGEGLFLLFLPFPAAFQPSPRPSRRAQKTQREGGVMVLATARLARA